MPKSARLTRSHDRIIGGVCAGIAEFLGWQPNPVRALYVLLSALSAAFPGVLVYLLLWWAMPAPDKSSFRLDDFRRQ